MSILKPKIIIPFIAAIALISVFAWKHYQDVNRYVSRGKFPDITVLMRASIEGDLAEVQSLLDRGADITLTGGFGHTALYFAIRGGNHDIVKLLLDAGADINDHYPEGHNDSRRCTLLATISEFNTKPTPENLELFSYLANLTPHDTSNHFCQIIFYVMHDQPKYLETFLSSLALESAAWEASRAQTNIHQYPAWFNALDPDMQQQFNDILSKYE